MFLSALVLLPALVILGFLLRRLSSRPPKPMELEVQIRTIPGESNRCWVHVSGTGELSYNAIVDWPWTLSELKESNQELFHSSSSEEDVKEKGNELFACIFGNDDLKSIYVRIRERAEETILRLCIDVDDELVDIPWEIMRDPLQEEFLALSKKCTLTRRASSVVGLPPVWELSRRLKVLLVAASPQEYQVLMIDQEVDVLKQTLGRLQGVSIDEVRPPTPSELLNELRRKSYQILHFAGHADRRGLILEDGAGHYMPLGTDVLIEAVSKPSLNMVFLNACETAGGVSQQGITSLASMLVSKGVPLVLAMQYAIPDNDALVFVRNFYHELTTTGVVDVSLNRARWAVYSARSGVEPPNWAIPVLFVRGSTTDFPHSLQRWWHRFRFHY